MSDTGKPNAITTKAITYSITSDTCNRKINNERQPAAWKLYISKTLPVAHLHETTSCRSLNASCSYNHFFFLQTCNCELQTVFTIMQVVATKYII